MSGTSSVNGLARRLILAAAFAVALLIGGASGYVLGTSAAAGPQAFSTVPTNVDGVRWTHEERPFDTYSVNGIRWTHEERP